MFKIRLQRTSNEEREGGREEGDAYVACDAMQRFFNDISIVYYKLER